MHVEVELGVHKHVHKDSHKLLQHGFKLSSEGGSNNPVDAQQTGLEEPLQFGWQGPAREVTTDLQRDLMLLTVSLESDSETDRPDSSS